MLNCTSRYWHAKNETVACSHQPLKNTLVACGCTTRQDAETDTMHPCLPLLLPQFDTVPGLIHVFINVLFGVAATIYVPQVYPHHQISSTTLPILIVCATACTCLQLYRGSRQQPQVQQTRLTAHRLQQHNQQIFLQQQLQQGLPGTSTTLGGLTQPVVPDDGCSKPAQSVLHHTEEAVQSHGAPDRQQSVSQPAKLRSQEKQIRNPSASQQVQVPQRLPISAQESASNETPVTAQQLVGPLGVRQSRFRPLVGN